MTSYINTTAMETAQDHHIQFRQWADLPKDALFCIILYVDMKIDLSRVRGVCTSWRSALPLAKLPTCDPHIKVPNLGEGNDLPPLILLESIFYFISPLPSSASAEASNCGDWIARMCESGTNKWHLLNPLKNDHVYENEHDLNYFYTESSIFGVINLLDCRVFELGRSMSLVHDLDCKKAKDLFKKVVGGWDFSSSYLFAASVQLEQEEATEGDLLLWMLGDQQWLKIVEVGDAAFRIHDIAFPNGKFYIFEVMSSSQWRVRLLDVGSSSVAESFTNGPDILLPAEKMLLLGVDGVMYTLWSGLYLVPSKSKSCLYLVIDGISVEGNKLTRKLLVLEMKKDESKWEHVQNLKDEIFFVCYYLSFALPSSTQNLPQWKPNSICLFLDRNNIYYELHSSEGCGRGMPEGVKCLKHVKYPSYNKHLCLFIMDGSEKGVLLFNKMPENEGQYTGHFFPPPPWVKWHCPSRDNVEVKFDSLGFHDREANTGVDDVDD